MNMKTRLDRGTNLWKSSAYMNNNIPWIDGTTATHERGNYGIGCVNSVFSFSELEKHFFDISSLVLTFQVLV